MVWLFTTNDEEDALTEGLLRDSSLDILHTLRNIPPHPADLVFHDKHGENPKKICRKHLKISRAQGLVDRDTINLIPTLLKDNADIWWESIDNSKIIT